MKQVCWHSRRSKAYRGLPEARMAGAPVEEISSKALPAVAKSTPTTAKLMCVFPQRGAYTVPLHRLEA